MKNFYEQNWQMIPEDMLQYTSEKIIEIKNEEFIETELDEVTFETEEASENEVVIEKKTKKSWKAK